MSDIDDNDDDDDDDDDDDESSKDNHTSIVKPLLLFIDTVLPSSGCRAVLTTVILIGVVLGIGLSAWVLVLASLLISHDTSTDRDEDVANVGEQWILVKLNGG